MSSMQGTDWETRESGPEDAERTALLLPGGLCTAMFYEELMAEPGLAGVHLVAVTLPGNGGSEPPADLGVENYARMTSELAADLGCDVVVGHSFGANVAIEMAGSGGFRGPVVLLAPSFCREDEAMFIRVLDHLARVLGSLPYAAMLKMMGGALSGSPLPPRRRAELVAELHKNDPAFMRRAFRQYLQYLDAHSSVAPRLCAAGVPAWVVHGETGDGGVTPQERETLAACPSVRLVTIPGRSFITQCEEPALVAGLLLDALALVGQPPSPEAPPSPSRLRGSRPPR